MRVLVAGAIVMCCVTACSPSHQRSHSTPTRPSAANLPQASPARLGTITGRYYADGGPVPLGYAPPRPIAGTITVTNTRTHVTYRPHQDSRGAFAIEVPVGTYAVAARSDQIEGPLTRIVTVTAGATVDADLGIHMT